MKIDKEIVEESKREIRNMLKNGIVDDNVSDNQFNQGEEKENAQTREEPTTQNSSPINDKEKEIEEKFAKYSDKFKNFTGKTIVEFVDDFKTNILWLYALKNKINIPKEAFKMPDDGKEMCAALLDYAVQDKLLEYIKKYPIIAAGAIIGMNAGSSYLLIEAMKSNQPKETKQKDVQPKSQEDKKYTAEDTINNLV